MTTRMFLSEKISAGWLSSELVVRGATLSDKAEEEDVEMMGWKQQDFLIFMETASAFVNLPLALSSMAPALHFSCAAGEGWKVVWSLR